MGTSTVCDGCGGSELYYLGSDELFYTYKCKNCGKEHKYPHPANNSQNLAIDTLIRNLVLSFRNIIARKDGIINISTSKLNAGI